MRNTWHGLLLFLLLLPLPAYAQTGEQIKEGHRAAALRYQEALAAGVKLSGTVDQNGSPGTFSAYFLR